MTKILVIEDEKALRHAIIEGLKSLGFHVDGVGDGAEALDAYYNTQYDLILLDLNLPHIDGLTLLKEFRADSLTVKIIILSARSEVEDKVDGINLGANDYLAKPFNFVELVARMNSLLSREFVQHPSIIKVRDYELDVAQKSFRYQGNEIELTNTEYEIILYLFRHQQVVVTTEQLVDTIWHDDASSKDRLKVYISKLRNKMPDELIFNKWGVGYYVE